MQLSKSAAAIALVVVLLVAAPPAQAETAIESHRYGEPAVSTPDHCRVDVISGEVDCPAEAPSAERDLAFWAPFPAHLNVSVQDDVLGSKVGFRLYAWYPAPYENWKVEVLCVGSCEAYVNPVGYFHVSLDPAQFSAEDVQKIADMGGVAGGTVGTVTLNYESY